MSNQEFAQAQPQRHEPEKQADEQDQVQVNNEDLSVDSVLDDIDSVLETDASDFVQAFVQKGGE